MYFAVKLIKLFVGYFNVVEALLKNGTDVNIQEENGRTPLHYAAQKGKVEVGRLLIKKNANIDARTTDDGRTPMFIAAEEGGEIIHFWLHKILSKM